MYIVAKSIQWYIHLIPKVKPLFHYNSIWYNKAPMSPMRILNLDFFAQVHRISI